MQIEIEPVKNNEVQILSDISSRCFYDTFYKHNTAEDMELFLEKSFNINVLQQEIIHAHNYFFFCKSGSEIMGYIKLSDTEVPEKLKEFDALEIARIYVVKEKIGWGIGKSLMDFAFSFARQMKKPVTWLGVWEHNSHAISFYRKYGFEKFDEQIFMVGNDAQTDWLMKKEVTA